MRVVPLFLIVNLSSSCLVLPALCCATILTMGKQVHAGGLGLCPLDYD
jgi:hypothetical protein